MFLGTNYNQAEVQDAIIECKKAVHKLSQEVSIIALMNPNSKQLHELLCLYEKKKLLLKHCQKNYLKALSHDHYSTMMLSQTK